MENNRSKFALVLNALKPMTPIVRIGYQNYKYKQTPFNAAMSYNLANAVDGDYPDYQLNWGRLMVSRGSLALPHEAGVRDIGGLVGLSWSLQPGGNSDVAFVAVLNEEAGEGKLVEEGNARRIGGMKISIPSEWYGQTLHVYLAFRRGNDVSDSVYAGPVIVNHENYRSI
ncbi:MAG: hypothetical protein BGN96_12230 [Bacteroidales bacterium 45-6]|nr:MAG: hypothetical protein BGN96_12230 [Bacteroidales bacterium 45-6]